MTNNGPLHQELEQNLKEYLGCENLELYVMPGTHHNTPQRMKAAGVLDLVINACFAGKQRVLNKTMGKTLQARRIAVAGAE